MRVESQGNTAIASDPAVLERMIGPDEHRPGPARARLRAEQIPVWAIIGHLHAVASAADQPNHREQGHSASCRGI